jgi:hypothetical protein
MEDTTLFGIAIVVIFVLFGFFMNADLSVEENQINLQHCVVSEDNLNPVNETICEKPCYLKWYTICLVEI